MIFTDNPASFKTWEVKPDHRFYKNAILRDMQTVELEGPRNYGVTRYDYSFPRQTGATRALVAIINELMRLNPYDDDSLFIFRGRKRYYDEIIAPKQDIRTGEFIVSLRDTRRLKFAGKAQKVFDHFHSVKNCKNLFVFTDNFTQFAKLRDVEEHFHTLNSIERYKRAINPVFRLLSLNINTVMTV